MIRSYAAYLVVFVVLPIALLLVVPSRARAERDGGRRRTALVGTGIMVLVAVAYTTPWDNYLIGRGVWSYPPGSVLLRVGHAPIEEYAYMALQPVLAAAWLYRHRLPDAWASAGRVPRVLGAVGWLAVALAGLLLLRTDSGLYLGSLLAWSAPVFALQWAVGGGYLWAERRLLARAVAVPTAYLWVADWLAVEWGLWRFSARYTTGVDLLGLPIEEAVFFLITTLLVVQGLVLYHWVVESVDLRVASTELRGVVRSWR